MLLRKVDQSLRRFFSGSRLFQKGGSGPPKKGTVKKGGYILFILINLFSLLLLAIPPVSAVPPSFIAEIVAVIDGDTIKILKSRQVITVRLGGIDAPDKEQRYAEEAKSFIESIAFGKKVVINWRGGDHDEMVLAEVVLGDGRSLNREIVKAGYAWWYRQYSDDLSLWRLEGQAREKRLGLWLGERPIPPWEFRGEKHSKR